jgi:PAS domain S-box-containing protein
MKKPLCALFIDDSEDDVLLLRRHFEQEGYALVTKRVETAAAFDTALAERAWDIILSDYKLRGFDGLAALRKLREQGFNVPFIMVSSVGGEELAVDAMRAGVDDFLVKDRLSRLVPAVKRAIRDAQFHCQRRLAEKSLRRSEDRYRGMVQASAMAVWTTDPTGRVTEDSPSWRSFTGQTHEEYLGFGWLKAIHPDDRAHATADWQAAVDSKKSYQTEYRIWHTASGTYRNTLARGVPLFDDEGSIREWVGMNIDITDLRQAEARQRESEERWRLALAASGTGWWHWDFTTGVLDGDAKARVLIGLPPDEAIETLDRVVEHTHPEDVKPLQQCAAELMANSSDQEVEFRTFWPDGSIHWILAKGRSFQTIEGKPLYGMGIVMDLTARKTAEQNWRESEQRLRAMFEKAAVGIIEVDREDHCIAFNDYICRLLGYSREELVGITAHDLTYPDDRPRSDAYYKELHEGRRNSFAYDKRYRKRDGSPLWVHVTVSAIRDSDGRHIASIGTVEDISERKRTEASIRQLNQVLKQRNAELAVERKQLKAAKEAAEQANRAKDHFFAVLSHELRTPLTPVVMAVSMIQNRQDWDAEIREIFEMIHRNIEMEARLIDDLLDITCIARGKIELHKQRVELCKVISQAVEVCRSDIDARQLHFGVDFGPHEVYWIEADASRLQQVFWNLLKNAIKFTPHGGCVGVRCRLMNQNVVVEVNDSGVGIEPEALLRIFNAFEQAERSITRQFGGLGLGLAISKALVEMHGGSIEAFSEGKDKGATFRVHLPLAMPNGQSPELSPALLPKPITRPLRILLVEDHGVTAKIMQMVLAAEGHVVEMAGDLTTARRLADKQAFDLLISDLGLPDGSGHDLMRQIRERGHRFPGIALSGYGQEDDIKRSHDAGFAAHLIKPASREAVMETIASVMTEKESATANEMPESSKTSTPTFDAQAALKQCMGDEEMLAQMIQFFFTDYASLLPQIHAALQQGDLPKLGKLAHRLKGTLLYLSADIAREAAAEVERVGLYGGQLTEAEDAVRWLKRECELLKASLTEYQNSTLTAQT